MASRPAFVMLLLALTAACGRSSPSGGAPDARPRSPAPAAPAVDAHPPPAPAAARPTPAAPLGPRGKLITLLYSSNLRGEYEAHPLGGLGRRARAAMDAATD